MTEYKERDIILTAGVLKERNLNNKISITGHTKQAVQFLNTQAPQTGIARPGLVLPGNDLPWINLQKLLANSKTITRLKAIPAILHSTSTLAKSVLKSYKNYYYHYISKPVAPEYLFEVGQKIENCRVSILYRPKND